MWIALLVGLGVGVLGLMAFTLARDRRFRRILSDAHLLELARVLGDARAATATTSEGLSFSWHAVGLHAALVMRSRARLVPELVRFMLGVAARVVGADITALLVLPDGGWALIVPGPVPSPGPLDPSAWRTAGVEAMRAQPLVPGALAAYH